MVLKVKKKKKLKTLPKRVRGALKMSRPRIIIAGNQSGTIKLNNFSERVFDCLRLTRTLSGKAFA